MEAGNFTKSQRYYMGIIMAQDRNGLELKVGDRIIIEGRITLIDGNMCVIEQTWSSNGDRHNFWVKTDCIDRMSTEEEVRNYAEQTVCFEKFLDEFRLLAGNMTPPKVEHIGPAFILDKSSGATQ